MEILGALLCFGIGAFCIVAALKWTEIEKLKESSKSYDQGFCDGYNRGYVDASSQNIERKAVKKKKGILKR